MTRGTPDGWHPVVVRMPTDLVDAVRKKAAAEERSMAQMMRWALRHYVGADTPEEQ